MKYTLHCEFNGFGGELISLSLVREDNEALYIVFPHEHLVLDPWVRENVKPILWSIPSPFPGWVERVSSSNEGGHCIAHFLSQDYINPDPTSPYIISDWPDDIKYFCDLVITGPGTMVDIPRLQFDMIRVDAYPCPSLPSAVQHNAFWDAKALQVKLDLLKG